MIPEVVEEAGTRDLHTQVDRETLKEGHLVSAEFDVLRILTIQGVEEDPLEVFPSD